MKKMHLTLLCGVTLLAASAAFAADAKMEKKDAHVATAAQAPDMHHRGRPFVVRGNQGFHYGDHLNRYTMQSHGTPKKGSK
jgi:hypothetical protein